MLREQKDLRPLENSGVNNGRGWNVITLPISRVVSRAPQFNYRPVNPAVLQPVCVQLQNLTGGSAPSEP
eukprot:m.83633 g.83633  ORF g.83633 m.83633 type:complete len:69 (-) comp11232_c0_seq2:2-208(-)